LQKENQENLEIIQFQTVSWQHCYTKI